MFFFRLICAVVVFGCAILWFVDSENPQAEPRLAVVAAAVVVLEIIVETTVVAFRNGTEDGETITNGTPLETNDGPNIEQSSDENEEETLQLIPCQYCNASGSVLKNHDRHNTVYVTCGLCNGHGEIRSELWSQPDCRRCNGSGKLISITTQRIGRKRYSTEYIQPCDVCGGIGKRPIA